MSLVPAMDLGHGRGRTEDDGSRHDNAPKVQPHNMEAEQALLGVLLYDNGAYERLIGVQDGHFYEPFHNRLFAAIETKVRKGQLAEPILLADEFAKDPAFIELGGLRYLADLVDRAPPAINIADYGRAIYDLACRRALILLAGEIEAEARGDVPLILPARDQIELAEKKLFSLAKTGDTQGGPQSFAHYLTGAVVMAAEAYSRPGGISGLATELIDLDDKLGGLRPTDLIVIAGRPSMGKTALATNIAFNIARRYAYEVQPDGSHKTVSGGRVLFDSLEMSGEQLALRILAEASEISSHKIAKGEIQAHEFGRIRDAATELNEIPLYIDATGGISLAKLVARARRQKRLTGLDLVVVDYLQLIDAGIIGDSNRVVQITMITMALKALAKELECPVIALSQLSRQVEQREDKRPQLSDLRESGSIEQDADQVWFVYREQYYRERAEPREGTPEHIEWQVAMEACEGLADCIIAKQRHGPIGTVRLAFNPDLAKFSNLSRDRRP
jgi:replicative DNA helicase